MKSDHIAPAACSLSCSALGAAAAAAVFFNFKQLAAISVHGQKTVAAVAAAVSIFS